MTDKNQAALAEFDVHYVEPSTMDLGDTPDSVIDYIAALNLKIAKLETGIIKAALQSLTAPSAGVDVSRAAFLLRCMIENMEIQFPAAIRGGDGEADLLARSKVMRDMLEEALTSIPAMREAWLPLDADEASKAIRVAIADANKTDCMVSTALYSRGYKIVKCSEPPKGEKT